MASAQRVDARESGVKIRALAAAVAGCVAFAAGAALADPPPALQTYELTGTVGAHGVGLSLTVKDGTGFDVGHYFYDSQLKDIPLTGSLSGRTVTLTEPGGGIFHLTMQGNGGQGGDGSSLETSVELDGTWTQGAQTLPVKLSMDTAYPGEPSAHRYVDVTTASDGAFEGRVRSFITAALAGDKATAAASVSYPLSVNGPPSLTIRTPAALLANWTRIFTPKLLAQLRTAVPHDMFVHEGEAMVAGGLVWFDAKGAQAINEP
jgi:hypothetical protein